ncbi:large T antigen [KI polyomavirus Stockholm 350]|uniref:Large T antigen n=2 Tax=Betapolyomavirus tertihominis TaxID=1891764 RepID=LT_POVKI|nr:RecName: Full=Large T antigen; Short=LT; Short=LT-AG [KI polyomavirus Stockholm 350]ABR68688.1 large T antigen [Betapolyomavirus tertihominis]ABN09926.1 large T antigen [KI polyomavirus Stockholm 350]AHB32976.1 large T antigen [Betapolyomavirus tertihominis]AIN39533.1 large T antigen [Betapolyomavirus tertihominis]ANY58914.1 large T antigen [Betapolyomavirus tertihominis]
MDKTLSREEAKQLMQLLCLDMSCWGNLPLMRRQYLVKCKEYHPDKGGNEESMKLLNSLYLKLQDSVSSVHDLNEEEDNIWQSSQIPTYGTPDWDEWWSQFNTYWEEELRCNESMPSSPKRSAPEEEPSCSQATPPKKKHAFDASLEFPKELLEFVSHAVFSNKCITCFVVHTTREKGEVLYKKLLQKYQCSFISKHAFYNTVLIFFLTPHKHRVSAINNFCKGHCTVSFLFCKGVNNPYGLYSRMCRQPFNLCEENIPGGLKENEFNPEDLFGEPKEPSLSWNQIANFALEFDIDDVYYLLGSYIRFATKPEECEKCSKNDDATHKRVHVQNHENAVLLQESKSQKNACTQAIDRVIAERRYNCVTLTRKKLLTKRFKKLFNEMDKIVVGERKILLYMASIAWYTGLNKKIDELVVRFLKLIVDNKPKHRYWLFKGPINSGKTTLATALLNLCGGKALNINIPSEKLPFELGVALDQYMVVFEDVKGQIGIEKQLPSGNGVNNLDNLRDYLDGCVEVNLEKKHVNKRSQIFPPGIVTMNEYCIPETVAVRFEKTVMFTIKRNLRESLEKTPQLLSQRILHSGIAMLLLLIWYRPVSDFDEEIQSNVVYWKEVLDNYIGLTEFATMQMNVTNGKNILEKWFE